jgi:Xaa-Pro aminopeptidase
MADAGLDVLVVGRPANVAYVTGARGLWTAGTRGFGPGAVVVRGTGDVHLLSVWDEGVPADIPHSHLYGLSWNPATLAARVAAVPGLAPDAVIGVDAMSPLWASLLPGRLVDASGVMWAARRIKSDEEVACVSAACAIAEAGLSAVVEAALRPRVSRGELVGAFDERIASLGVTTPSLDVVWGDGDLRRLHAAVLFQGYEGGLGRTLGCSPGETERWQAAFDRLVDACRPGATGADLIAAWTSTGEDLPPPSTPLVHGVGLGVEPPVIGAGIGAGDGAVLDAGMVLAVQGQVGSYFGKETVLIHSDGPEVLTRFPIHSGVIS